MDNSLANIIPIHKGQVGTDVKDTVNARQLHTGLELKKDFSDWIKAQILRARLVENMDFVTIPQKGVGGKFNSTEYHLTIDAAKHIAMMSGTDKGVDVRRYFIECESKALAPRQVTGAEMILMLAQQLVDNERRVASVETKVQSIENKMIVKEQFKTALEFSIGLGLDLDKSELRKLGCDASKISRRLGLEISTKHQDNKGFRGNVNAYHHDALFEALEEMETT